MARTKCTAPARPSPSHKWSKSAGGRGEVRLPPSSPPSSSSFARPVVGLLAPRPSLDKAKHDVVLSLLDTVPPGPRSHIEGDWVVLWLSGLLRGFSAVVIGPLLRSIHPSTKNPWNWVNVCPKNASRWRRWNMSCKVSAFKSPRLPTIVGRFPC
ncbi:hypothetical protein LIER_43299 [Lithospermum erythrorhizon]|uniref:Uncharacterized protein n=1 Tax=Lithospermum erythrorhizon TaxID=34254 RepID=A0AAV3PT39_LITER